MEGERDKKRGREEGGKGEKRRDFPIFDLRLKKKTESLKWVRKNISKFGGDEQEIHVMGHSAGAHLVMMGALLGCWREREREGEEEEGKEEGEGEEGLWRVRSLMLYSGVYNIHEHFKFESGSFLFFFFFFLY